ncbi:hypothetical protein LCGC14_2821140, partial [marine sediment metagenome]
APDYTTFAEHITESGIVSMAYQQQPEPVLWCVLANGKLIGMTFEPGQKVWGWFNVVTDGLFEDVAVIPGVNEDEVWVIVKRTLPDGTVSRNIEYFKPRNWGSDQKDCFFVDSGLTFDGGDTVNVSNATQASPCVITVQVWPTEGDGSNLGDGDQIKIVDVTGMTELNGNIYTMASSSVSDKTFNLRNSVNTANIDSGSFTTYTSTGTGTVQRFENSFAGFDHIEGKTASVLADAIVQDDVTISSGAFSINRWSNKVHAGLSYTSIIKTLPIVLDGAVGAKTKISRANINFYQSLGTLYGLEGDTEDCFAATTTLQTDWRYLSFQQGYTRNAHIYLEQTDPLPLTVRAIVPSLVTTEN